MCMPLFIFGGRLGGGDLTSHFKHVLPIFELFVLFFFFFTENDSSFVILICLHLIGEVNFHFIILKGMISSHVNYSYPYPYDTISI